MGMMGCYSVAVVILRLGFATKIDTTPFQLRDGRKEKATFLVPELTENFIQLSAILLNLGAFPRHAHTCGEADKPAVRQGWAGRQAARDRQA